MVGKLLINNLAFYPGDEFGGPILFYNSYAFIPTVKRSLFGDYRFKIGVLNLKTKRFRTGGQKEWVVIPFEADDEYVYYFITVDLSKQKMFRYIE